LKDKNRSDRFYISETKSLIRLLSFITLLFLLLVYLSPPVSNVYAQENEVYYHLYVGTVTSPAYVQTILLPNFTITHELQLESGENDLADLEIFGEHLYGQCSTYPVKIVKMKLPTTEAPELSREAVLTMASGEDVSGGLDKDNQYLYVGIYSPARIMKIDPANFTVVDNLTLTDVSPALYDIVVVGGYLYGAIFSVPAEIVKVDLSTFTQVANLTLGSGENYGTRLAEADGYLYVGLAPSGVPGKIAKIDLSTFTKNSTLTLDSGEKNVEYLVVSDSYLYASLNIDVGKVVKVNLSTFTKVQTLNVLLDSPCFLRVDVNGTFLYSSGYDNDPGKVAQIDLSTFTVDDTLTFPAGRSYASGMAIALAPPAPPPAPPIIPKTKEITIEEPEEPFIYTPEFLRLLAQPCSLLWLLIIFAVLLMGYIYFKAANQEWMMAIPIGMIIAFLLYVQPCNLWKYLVVVLAVVFIYLCSRYRYRK